MNAFNKILKIQSLNDDYTKFYEKQKYNHITFKILGYNNVVLKVYLNYYI